MQLISARITKFKSIDNSGQVTIDPDVTVLVGQNESGKTAFLQALHKVNPVEAGLAYNIIEEYPRKELTAYRKRHEANPDVVAVVTYELSENERAFINATVGIEVIPADFQFTRTVSYGGSASIGGFHFEESDYVKHVLKGRNLGEDTAKQARSAADVPELIAILEREDLNTDGLELLQTLKSRFGKVPSTWQKTPLSRYVWSKHVEPLIPKFLYFDDYSLLPDKTNLKSLKQSGTCWLKGPLI
jgi:hypothetical protein